MKKGMVWIIKKNLALICACVLFLALYSYGFEPFINSNGTSLVQLTENSEISKIEIAAARDILNDTWINLAGLEIVDEQDNIVKYWEAPNSVHFSNGDLGDNHQDGPIWRLWDDNPDTYAHSSTFPDTLTIILVPPKKIGSVQITNRTQGWSHRIGKYDLVFYKSVETGYKEIARKPLINLAEKGKSITYLLSKASIKGEQGPTGPTGPAGPAGPAGPIGLTGLAGVTGLIGPTGPIGPQGPEGKVGPQGPDGKSIIGPQGKEGPQGVQGIQGPIGLTGPEGPTGLMGPVGPIGPMGLTGPEGPAGPEGPQGVVRVDRVHKVLKDE